jgi:hypothetical protein
VREYWDGDGMGQVRTRGAGSLGLLAALAGVELERGRRRGRVRLQAGLGPLGPASAGLRKGFARLSDQIL